MRESVAIKRNISPKYRNKMTCKMPHFVKLTIKNMHERYKKVKKYLTLHTAKRTL